MTKRGAILGVVLPVFGLAILLLFLADHVAHASGVLGLGGVVLLSADLWVALRVLGSPGAWRELLRSSDSRIWGLRPAMPQNRRVVETPDLDDDRTDV